MHNGSVTDNPFAVLTAVVAPAILTNACSVLALGTSNRVARVVDQTRILVREMSAEGSRLDDRPRALARVGRLERRAHLLLTALRIIYGALGGFAACALVSVIGAVVAYYDSGIWFRVATVGALVCGMSAVVALVSGCAVMVTETRLALIGVHEAVEESLKNRVI